jgi:hypothetical protein
MLEACSLASSVPLQLASFFKSTWDFTLYSEGFLAPWIIGFDDGKSPFISLEELVRHETLDARYMSIGDFCEKRAQGIRIPGERITPPELAGLVEADCELAMKLINKFRNEAEDPTLVSELDDLETWCHLGFYFADKLRAGVAWETKRITGEKAESDAATLYLTKCIGHWKNVVRLTQEPYQPMPYVSMGHHQQKWPGFTAFHWDLFSGEVRADLEFVQRGR